MKERKKYSLLERAEYVWVSTKAAWEGLEGDRFDRSHAPLNGVTYFK